MKNNLVELLSESLDVDVEEIEIVIEPKESPLESVEKWAEGKTGAERKAFIEGVLTQALVIKANEVSGNQDKINNMFR